MGTFIRNIRRGEVGLFEPPQYPHFRAFCCNIFPQAEKSTKAAKIKAILVMQYKNALHAFFSVSHDFSKIQTFASYWSRGTCPECAEAPNLPTAIHMFSTGPMNLVAEARP